METKYTNLKELVGNEFIVEKAYGFTWKRWDNEAKRMLVAERHEQGFSKRYTLETDKGKLDISGAQLGQMLEGAYSQGKADLIGRTFKVASNGKTGMEIRYYLNPVRETVRDTVATVTDADLEKPIDLNDIPF